MIKDNSDHKKNLLIVFVKNSIVGSVKSRLALTIGYKNALEIYNDLVIKTHAAVNYLTCDKQVAYSAFIDKDDIWESDIFNKVQQYGKDIGERMLHAFSIAFEAGYENVVLIGSDIINLRSGIIYDAFNRLQQSDLVLGPANDGGYYLIGLKQPVKQLFENKDWSTNKVFIQTLKDCFDLDLTLRLVQELADLDRIEDFQYLKPEDWQMYIDIIEKDASKLTHTHLFHFIKKGA